MIRSTSSAELSRGSSSLREIPEDFTSTEGGSCQSSRNSWIIGDCCEERPRALRARLEIAEIAIETLRNENNSLNCTCDRLEAELERVWQNCEQYIKACKSVSRAHELVQEKLNSTEVNLASTKSAFINKEIAVVEKEIAVVEKEETIKALKKHVEHLESFILRGSQGQGKIMQFISLKPKTSLRYDQFTLNDFQDERSDEVNLMDKTASVLSKMIRPWIIPVGMLALGILTKKV